MKESIYELKTFGELSDYQKQKLKIAYECGAPIQWHRIYKGWISTEKPGWLSNVKYRINPNLKESVMKQKTKKSWSFQSISIEDIDWKLIIKDLSKKNPVALIELEDGTGYVVCYDQLINKASIIGKPFPDALKRTVYPSGVIYKVEKQHFNRWVQWAKEVKAAKWPKKYHNKRKVTVSLPTI